MPGCGCCQKRAGSTTPLLVPSFLLNWYRPIDLVYHRYSYWASSISIDRSEFTRGFRGVEMISYDEGENSWLYLFMIDIQNWYCRTVHCVIMMPTNSFAMWNLNTKFDCILCLQTLNGLHQTPAAWNMTRK